jgi:NAD+ synthase (glutamine-hydrolysing)
MGFFLPLSGGADSASSALVVYNMCEIVWEAIHKKGDEDTLHQLQQVLRESTSYLPKTPKEICARILYTAYMGSEHSSSDTRARAELLSREINCTHYNLSIN